ncbi:MAG TPA: cytochrome c oxidase assembly protein [Pirellulaceae bacterium]|nr:cytochrome c oxidase assembly protein [Pirellulaceae bacterium]
MCLGNRILDSLFRREVGAVAAASLAMLAGVAHADGGNLTQPATWLDWTFDPVLAANLALGGWLYFAGARRLIHESRTWRSASRSRTVAFAVAWATLILALQSPLDAMSEQLASAHMVQHMLIMTIAAPAFVISQPGRVWLAALTHRSQETIRTATGRISPVLRASRDPCLAFALFAAATWTWHFPPLYEGALVRPVLHDLQHLTFFGAAFLFWRALLDPVAQRRVHPFLGILLLFATTLHTTLLSVLMTIAPQPWYATYLERTAMWGWTASEDQRLAGLIMWMPACVPYLLAALSLLASVLKERGSAAVRPLPQFDR